MEDIEKNRLLRRGEVMQDIEQIRLLRRGEVTADIMVDLMLSNDKTFFKVIDTFQVSQPDRRGLTLLELSLMYKKETHLVEILKRYVSSNVQLTGFNRDIVVLALNAGVSKDTILSLINAGASVSEEHLRYAIENKVNDDILLVLLGVLTNVATEDLASLYMCAVKNNCIQFVKDVVVNNYNIQDGSGNTLLMKAAVHSCGCLVEFLLGKNVNINQRNSDGYTALMLAVECKNKKVVEKLLAAGADKTLENKYAETASSIASFSDDADILSMLNTN